MEGRGGVTQRNLHRSFQPKLPRGTMLSLALQHSTLVNCSGKALSLVCLCAAEGRQLTWGLDSRAQAVGCLAEQLLRGQIGWSEN